MKKAGSKILITKDGPYVISGDVPIDCQSIVPDKAGVPLKWSKCGNFPNKKGCALCRCGKSGKKPFCDGSHVRVKFDGTETASNQPYKKQAEKYPGHSLDLTDAESFCSGAKFCHRAGKIWNLIENSDSKSKKIAIEEACNCPSGRLVVWDKKTGKPIELKSEPSISITECPPDKVSGPIWVKGKIPIVSARGKKYETRQRVTLCRCGQSRNKPFCDGSHIAAGFTDKPGPEK